MSRVVVASANSAPNFVLHDIKTILLGQIDIIFDSKISNCIQDSFIHEKMCFVYMWKVRQKFMVSKETFVHYIKEMWNKENTIFNPLFYKNCFSTSNDAGVIMDTIRHEFMYIWSIAYSCLKCFNTSFQNGLCENFLVDCAMHRLAN